MSRRTPIVLTLLLGLVSAMVATAATSSAGATTRSARPGTVAAADAVGKPPRDYVIPATSHFSFPNRSHLEKVAIRNRVLYTIQSVWGGPRDPENGVPLPGTGTIRIATWSFNDWAMAKALIAARNRGVSVQIMAAAGANDESRPWQYLRKHLGAYLYRPGYPDTREQYSFARQCHGACRGHGGTPHSKYFLFDNVGSQHVHDLTVQTSMNLTTFAYRGQWNQAQVVHSSSVYDDFLGIFKQTRWGRPVANPYHVASMGNVVDLFFPHPGANAAGDPVMQILNHVYCRGATGGGTRTGHTRVRIIQYAIYGNRGNWIAKKLRYLWNAGCDVGIIYGVSSRPVLNILRSSAGRGPVPMRQSVIKNNKGEIVKYNHSKWMTITGHWGADTAAYLTFTGSANWADLSFSSDEQMQRISSYYHARRYLSIFGKTWRQKTSKLPPSGRLVANARGLSGVPEYAPDFGHGIYKYMTED